MISAQLMLFRYFLTKVRRILIFRIVTLMDDDLSGPLLWCPCDPFSIQDMWLITTTHAIFSSSTIILYFMTYCVLNLISKSLNSENKILAMMVCSMTERARWWRFDGSKPGNRAVVSSFLSYGNPCQEFRHGCALITALPANLTARTTRSLSRIQFSDMPAASRTCILTGVVVHRTPSKSRP